MGAITIRKGKKADLPKVLDLIQELAVYEKEPDAVEVTLEEMERYAFGKNPVFEFWVSETAGKKIAGVAITYVRYSTWKGPVMYLEDFVVADAFRRKGIGAMLFEELLQETLRRGYHQMGWQVLDWNEPAIRFYEKYNAQMDGQWVNGRITRDQIKDMDSAR